MIKFRLLVVEFAYKLVTQSLIAALLTCTMCKILNDILILMRSELRSLMFLSHLSTWRAIRAICLDWTNMMTIRMKSMMMTMSKLSKTIQVLLQTVRVFEWEKQYFCWWVLFSSSELIIFCFYFDFTIIYFTIVLVLVFLKYNLLIEVIYIWVKFKFKKSHKNNQKTFI